MPKIWVDVEDSAGNKYGSGPLKSCITWQNTERLDRAGEITAVFLLNDPQIALIQNRRYLAGYTLVNGEVASLGIMRIDSVRITGQVGGIPAVEVKGDNLLRELADRSVGFLQLAEIVNVNPELCNLTNGGTIDLPNLIDGDTGTGDDVQITTSTYLYIGNKTKWSEMSFDFGAKVNNNFVTNEIQYFNGSIWLTVGSYTDTTAISGATWAQDGTYDFVQPADWERIVHAGENRYWLRIHSNGAIDEVTINELTVKGLAELADDLPEVMSFAPAGWSLDTVNWYESTIGGSYIEFAGESVLTALVVLAEYHGEHFRLGNGREIDWLRKDEPQSTVWLQAAGYDSEPPSENIGLIRYIEKVADSYGMMNTIYPYGAGAGAARFNLTYSTDSPPAGITLNKNDNKLQHTAGAAAYGPIERHIEFKEILPLENNDVGNERAANALLEAAVEFLQRRVEVEEFYELEVVVKKKIWPGELVRVTYRSHQEGEVLINIDTTLRVLETTTVVDTGGFRTVSLTVATIDRWPDSEGGVVAGGLRQSGVFQAHAQPIDPTAVAGTVQIGGNVTLNNLTVTGELKHNDTAELGFYGEETIPRPEVTGSRGSSVALANLLQKLDLIGLITDSSSS